MASVRCISPRLCGLSRAVAALSCHILRCLVATRSERLPELAPHETLGASPPQWERITRFASSVAQTSNATTTMGVLALFGWASRCPPSAIQSAGEQPSNDSTSCDIYDCVIRCDACARQVGLWNYCNARGATPAKKHRSENVEGATRDGSAVFDPLLEHREFCVYARGGIPGIVEAIVVATSTADDTK